MAAQKLHTLDLKVISFLKRYHILIARIAMFVVFFWFGALKVLSLSPAGPLAETLTERTVGLEYFGTLFLALSLIECLIGILFLIPRAIRVVIPLLLIHMAVVSSPMLLVPDLVWQGFLTPTLEGQYIIKNIVIVALAIAVAADTKPLIRKT